MKLLVLGGTGFLGYHAVAAAFDAGHTVSMFTREGEVAGDGVEPLAGDRGGLSPLCVGGSGMPSWMPSTVRSPWRLRPARLLSGTVGASGFVSGITNYHSDGPRIVDEDAPLRELAMLMRRTLYRSAGSTRSAASRPWRASSRVEP